MEQKAYLSEVEALSAEQREALINTLMKLGHRQEVRGKRLAWAELIDLYPELAAYNVPTLRYYLEMCGCFWMLESVEADEEGFCQKGVVVWAQVRRNWGRMTFVKVFVIAFAIIGYLYMFGRQFFVPSLIFVGLLSLGAFGIRYLLKK